MLNKKVSNSDSIISISKAMTKMIKIMIKNRLNMLKQIKKHLKVKFKTRLNHSYRKRKIILQQIQCFLKFKSKNNSSNLMNKTKNPKCQNYWEKTRSFTHRIKNNFHKSNFKTNSRKGKRFRQSKTYKIKHETRMRKWRKRQSLQSNFYNHIKERKTNRGKLT